MNHNNLDKPKKIHWVIAILIVVIFVILQNLLGDLINIQIFENYKLYYCPGDKYFVGLDNSIKCFKIISLFRQPSLYCFIIFIICPLFIYEHYTKK